MQWSGEASWGREAVRVGRPGVLCRALHAHDLRWERTSFRAGLACMGPDKEAQSRPGDREEASGQGGFSLRAGRS